MNLKSMKSSGDNVLNPLLVALIEETINSAMTELKNENEFSKISSQQSKDFEVELITIKDCTKLIPGISYYTVRQLAEQKKIKSFRTGQGKHGKILIFKDSFLNYFMGGIS